MANNRRSVGAEIVFDQLGQESKSAVLGMKGWSGKTGRNRDGYRLPGHLPEG